MARMFKEGFVTERAEKGARLGRRPLQMLLATYIENRCGELVEPMGFEPTTSSMPSRRAPSCATAPPKERNYFSTLGAEGGVKPPLHIQDFRSLRTARLGRRALHNSGPPEGGRYVWGKRKMEEADL